jgi:hypothetical protein
MPSGARLDPRLSPNPNRSRLFERPSRIQHLAKQHQSFGYYPMAEMLVPDGLTLRADFATDTLADLFQDVLDHHESLHALVVTFP